MKYKIICPNKNYTGESASVNFANGIGYTNSDYLANWFHIHGYIVEETNINLENSNKENDKEKANRNELVKKCKELGIPTAKTDTVEILQAKIDALNAINKEDNSETGGTNE